MSGGQLVVLDRSGRDVKRYPLPEGLVTLGSDHSCDIRFMLDTVNPHHATVAVHANQTVVRNICLGETLVNGSAVSVAALQDGDVITIGGRRLRWEYLEPDLPRAQLPEPALHVPRRGRGRPRGRTSAPGGNLPRRERAVQLALEMSHRASMPANAGGKQVAIVQPQRRDTSEYNGNPTLRTPMQNKRPRTSKGDLDVSVTDSETDKAKRKSSLQNTTKATLWIESRKTSPRKSVKVQTPLQYTSMRRNIASAKKSTPLRLTVLKRAQSAQKMKVTKIEAPSKIDHTKQAALLLMTGHTPKNRLLAQKPIATPNTGTPKPSTSKTVTPKVTPRPVSVKTVTPKSGGLKVLKSKSPSPKKNSVGRSASFVVKKKSPINRSTPRGRRSRTSGTSTTPQLQAQSLRKSSHRSSQKSFNKSPSLPSPKKSALKNPSKRSMRKTESIKFDLSNLDNYTQDSDVFTLTDTIQSPESSALENERPLRYSSSIQSPSPRRSIHSRSSKILEKTIGTTITVSPSRTSNLESPQPRKSSRGSMILQKALNKSDETSYSRRTTKSLSDHSSSTIASAFRTRTLSPRIPQNDLESYSIVDLVSVDSNESGSASVYDSVGSTSCASFVTSHSVGRKTRSTIDPGLIGSSTPYIKIARMSTSKTSPAANQTFKGRQWSRGKSVTTPENSKHISVNSTRVSRASRSRSRLNDSDLMLIEDDDSPKTSKRLNASKRSNSAPEPRSSFMNTTASASPVQENGMSTPENTQSPEEASTPVLNIQKLLNSSQNSISIRKRGRPSLKRKTIGVLTGGKARVSAKSKSMNFNPTLTRSRLSNDSYEDLNVTNQDGEVVTPKSEVTLVQEAVKNKHSTAKKPQSKRTIIDDLNNSDIVKQLFNSPVKRKLSQSMTEFSRKQLFDDDDVVQVRRPTRNTIALTGRTSDNSLVDQSETFTPERFVSPISTPRHSPNLDGIKRLFDRNSPENDLRNVRGVKALLRTPRARKSIRNDLTNVSGTKRVFAKSPRNSLSNVRVKEMFAASPNNDLRRVSGVKSLFQSGKSPKNSLSDISGVKHLFRRDNNELDDLSGVEELFNESNQSHRDIDSLFDQLIGKPRIKAVYSKTFSNTKKKQNPRKHKTLHSSLDVISNNVEEWLEQELNKRLRKEASVKSNKSQLSRELQKLAINTVEGTTPLRTSRIRNSTIVTTSTEAPDRQKSASEVYSTRKLPIKKRSWVDASLEQSKNTSKSIYLPIKKRAVLHSTPVKGKQGNMTMNASELGRVSPIIADKTQDLEQEATSNLPTLASRSRRGQKSVAQSAEVPKSSPKKTLRTSKTSQNKDKPVSPEAKAPSASTKSVTPHKDVHSDKTKQQSPVNKSVTPKAVIPRSTRSRKTVAVTPRAEINKKRRTSLVIAKKTPVLRPQPKPSRKRVNAESSMEVRSPKRTRSTRKNDDKVVEKPKTPKKRTKVQKATVVVSKPSPQIKPRSTRAKAVQDISKAKPQVKQVSPKISPVQSSAEDVPKTRGRRVANVSKQNNSEVETQPKTKRGRRTNADVTTVRKTRNGNKQESVQPERKTKNTKDENIVKDVPKAKTRRANKEEIVLEAPNAKTKKTNKQVIAPAESKTRRGNKRDVIQEESKSTRQTNKRQKPEVANKVEAQSNIQSEPPSRTRRGVKSDNTIPERSTRKRKATTADDRPAKVSKNAEGEREKNKKASTKAVSKKAVKESKGKTQESAGSSSRTVRSRKVEVAVPSPKVSQRSNRGRKAAVGPEPAPEVGKRKRQNAALPAQGSQKRPRGRAAQKSPVAAVQAGKTVRNRTR